MIPDVWSGLQSLDGMVEGWMGVYIYMCVCVHMCIYVYVVCRAGMGWYNSGYCMVCMVCMVCQVCMVCNMHGLNGIHGMHGIQWNSIGWYKQGWVA